MSVGKDSSFGPRMKWFRQAIGEPWVYATHDGKSGRAFYIAIGLAHPAKGFTRETGSFRPDMTELTDMAKRMGYPEEQREEVGLWLHSAIGPEPGSPPGITKKPIPVPPEAYPKGKARNPHKVVIGHVPKPVEFTSDADPSEVAHAKELAACILMEAAEKGEKLSEKVLELVRAVRSMSAKKLAAFLVSAGVSVSSVSAGYADSPSRQIPEGVLLEADSDNDDLTEIDNPAERRKNKFRRVTPPGVGVPFFLRALRCAV